jgi:hypothetical protein
MTKFKKGYKVYDKNGKLFGKVIYENNKGYFLVLPEIPITGLNRVVVYYRPDGSINGISHILRKFPEIHQVFLKSEVDQISLQEETIELYLDDEGEYDEV